VSSENIKEMTATLGTKLVSLIGQACGFKFKMWVLKKLKRIRKYFLPLSNNSIFFRAARLFIFKRK